MRAVFNGADVLVLLLCAGCVGPNERLFPPKDGEATMTVYVVSHGWHTGIVVDRADVPRGVWPESNFSSNARYLEVGWGDEEFYQADDPSWWVTCKAAFWPTPSALHVVGFHKPVTDTFPNGEIIEVKLSRTGFEKLCGFIHRSYARDKKGETIPLGPGLYEEGRFYRARGRFYLPKTCNTWAARALRSAGCPITPEYAVTSGNLLWQTRKFGKTIQAAK